MIKNILPIGKGSAEGFLMTLEKIFMSKEKSAEAKIFIEKQFRDFDESAKERYLAVVLDYIHRNYPSSKEVA